MLCPTCGRQTPLTRLQLSSINTSSVVEHHNYINDYNVKQSFTECPVRPSVSRMLGLHNNGFSFSLLIYRPQWMHEMPTIATNVPVARCICLSSTRPRLAKAVARIQVLFGLENPGAQGTLWFPHRFDVAFSKLLRSVCYRPTLNSFLLCFVVLQQDTKNLLKKYKCHIWEKFATFVNMLLLHQLINGDSRTSRQQVWMAPKSSAVFKTLAVQCGQSRYLQDRRCRVVQKYENSTHCQTVVHKIYSLLRFVIDVD